MKIMFLCQYFPPEMGAPSARTYEHCKYWVRGGHDVTVITGFPNHPTGRLLPEYEGYFYKREIIDGIDLRRTWIYCTPNKGFFKRSLNFISFFISSVIFGSLFTKRPDVVIGTSPQLFCALSAYLVSIAKQVPFIFEVRDIWPQSAVELGALKNKTIIRVLEKIEHILYSRASLIVAVAESTRKYLTDKGIASEKINVITNGIDQFSNYENTFDAKTQRSRERKEIILKHVFAPLRLCVFASKPFFVSYIGTHGMSHSLDAVLQAARLIDDPSVHFLFVGEGAEKANLKSLASTMNLNNVTFIDEQPRDVLQSYYELSDVGIVPLKRLPIFTKVLPSKMFEWMGAERAIICSVGGEAAELIHKAQCGICIEPENPNALVEAITQLKNNREYRSTIAGNGRKFVREHYLRSTLAAKYINSLTEVLTQRRKEAKTQR